MEIITHINHSSILIESNGKKLLTDPWYFRNAFHGWAPYPQPDARSIDFLLKSDKPLDCLLISHAHDDHLDSHFIKQLPNDVPVVIPRKAGLGLRKRLNNANIKDDQIVSVDEDGACVAGFNITAISSGSLTSEDFIFTIRTKERFIVHANDNWHEYSRETVMRLRDSCAGTAKGSRYIFSQVGIADAYPLFYPEIDASKKREIIKQKCASMIESLITNGKKLEIDNLYAYANQSIFEKQATGYIDPYLLRDNAIAATQGKVIQCMPNMSIDHQGNIIPAKSLCPLVVERLERLKADYDSYAKKRLHISNDVASSIKDVRFECYEYKSRDCSSQSIFITASIQQWNRILCGEANLESIVTGGCGEVSVPKEYNMRREYGILVDWAYSAESRIKTGTLML